MANDPDPAAKPSPKQAREMRLAEALRANLKRRKAAQTGKKPAADGKNPGDEGPPEQKR